jgi:hypothetical protein
MELRCQRKQEAKFEIGFAIMRCLDTPMSGAPELRRLA